jgi:hypothetical protein
MRLPKVDRDTLVPDAPLDVVKALAYRPELFGRPYSELLQILLRGESTWSVGERELFAGYTAHLNKCPF